jgi:hypothetical protein
MAQAVWTSVAIALVLAWPRTSTAQGEPPTPGQATADRIMRRGGEPKAPMPGQPAPPVPGSAAREAAAAGAGMAPRGPGDSRDLPMPASGQDTTVMQPVDPGVADRGALAESLREMPMTLRVPGAFENVYPVPGRPGLFFRAQGALYMVFDEATYRFYKGTRYVTIPPGAVFYVGRPDWSTIPTPWFRGADADDSSQRGTQPTGSGGAAPLQAQVNSEVDPPGQSPEQLRAEGRVPVRRAAVGSELGRVPGHHAGFGSVSAARDPLDPAHAALAMRTAQERERDAAAPRAPDAAALAGVLPAGVARDLVVVDRDGQVQPRIVGDSTYRRERIAALMRIAADRMHAAASARARQ